MYAVVFGAILIRYAGFEYQMRFDFSLRNTPKLQSKNPKLAKKFDSFSLMTSTHSCFENAGSDFEIIFDISVHLKPEKHP